MKCIILLVTLAVAVNAQRPAALQRAGTMGADTSKWTPFQCRKGVLGPNDDRMSVIGGDCAKIPNQNCVFFCHATELGLLASDGLPKNEIYSKWVDTVIPAAHHTMAKAHFKDCYEKFGKNIDKSDTTCAMAKKFGDCTWSVQPKLTC